MLTSTSGVRGPCLASAHARSCHKPSHRFMQSSPSLARCQISDTAHRADPNQLAWKPSTAKSIPSIGKSTSYTSSIRSHSYLCYIGATKVIAAVGMAQLALQGPAFSSETLPPTALVLLQEFLQKIEDMGPTGALIFVLTVMLAEMVPLLPTQPLTLAGGILFGPVKGAVLVLTGLMLAAFNAFSISRGVGRPLAERVIKAEMSEGGGEGSDSFKTKIAEVEEVIRTGGFVQQLTAVALLRLTPVVPFSASNYLLGLMPLQIPAFLGGTFAGMAVWSVAYTSLGAASRKVLNKGANLEVLFTDLSEKAGEYTVNIALGGIGVAAVATAIWYVSTQTQTKLEEPLSSSEGVIDVVKSSCDAATLETTVEVHEKEKVMQGN